MDSSKSKDIKAEELENTSKKRFYTSVPFILGAACIAIVLVFAIIVALTLGTGKISWRDFLGKEKMAIDYLNDDLSEYINISEEDYKNYDIVVDIPKPTVEIDVENHILELLFKNRGGKLYDSKYQYDIEINPGDKAFIYYAGYFIDDGERVEIPSLTNYSSKNATELVIGSGDFPVGFELSLVGANPKDSETFVAKTYGKVADGEVVYAVASFVDEYGILHYDENVRIDLSDENVEEKWGALILNYLQEVSIGQINNKPITLTKGNGGNIYYSSIEVKYTTKCESTDDVTVIKVVYPYDYEDESLREKTVYFDVFIDKVICYESPEFDDTFITDVLKMTEEELSSCSGETLAEKYKNYYLSVLMDEYEEKCLIIAEELIWERFKEVIEINIPDVEYELLYKEYYSNFERECTEVNESGMGSYNSIETYIIDSLGLDEGTDVHEYLSNIVVDEITEKLIFYSILKKENMIPTEDEFKDIYERELRLDFEYYYEKTEADFESAEDYNKALDEYRKMLLEYYGEEYYIDSVYYNYAIDKIKSMANIIY